ncbi:hypothetical protein [Plantactinospora sp. WMMB782]|uniref:hypothetical protein n=1 Tax=Plantactinospora sp. WMMB782 TaxID=3404121 RepID=UPI003B957132
MDRYYMLEAIEARDPDGGEREPTAADYEAHKQWAIAAYGEDVWRQYSAGGWGETSDF